jgi:hypothetical protein
MVFGTRGRNPFPGHDRWYDIRSGDARGHWIPAEGDQLRTLLHELVADGVEAARIRVLSPFRQVAAEAGAVHRQVLGAPCSADDRGKWIGTVHTMQGREADVVILVLGGNPGTARRPRLRHAHPEPAQCGGDPRAPLPVRNRQPGRLGGRAAL